MNTAGDIIQEVYDDLNWEPDGSAEAQARMLRHLARACRDLANDAPSGFFETVEHIWLEPDDESASSGDTVALVVPTDFGSPDFFGNFEPDAWVFRTTHQRDEYTGAVVDWNTERLWDGRLIELKDADGNIYWNQVRTVWRERFSGIVPTAGKTTSFPASGAWDEYRFSVVNPWRQDLGTGPFTWRLVTPAYYLPSQYIRLSSLFTLSDRREIEFLTQDEVECRQLDAVTPVGQESTPLWAYKRPPMRLRAPAVAPTVAFSGSNNWLGPEPPGKFAYLVTYTWGKRDLEGAHPGLSWFSENAAPLDVSNIPQATTSQGTNRSSRPLWESAPSNLSKQIEVAFIPALEQGVPPAPPQAVEVTLPNIEYVLGFLMKGTGSVGAFERSSVARSGIHARIWRVRYTEDFDDYTRLGTAEPGFHVPALHKLDLREGEPQLLAEIRIDDSNEGKFIDDGRIIPDHLTPLKSQGLHPAIQLHPRPSERDRLDVRYIESPPVPKVLTDAIPVNDQGRKALVHKVIACEVGSTDAALASMHRSMYDAEISKLNKAADMKPVDQVTTRKPARSGRRGRRPRTIWWRD